MGQRSSLTPDQIRKIEALSGVLSAKRAARQIGCTDSQVKHFWKMLAKRERRAPIRLSRPSDQQMRWLQDSARSALREEVAAIKAERATAPVFRLRPDEWPTRVTA